MKDSAQIFTENLTAIERAEERLGGQEALRAGLVALQAAVETGRAVMVGSNVVGTEVNLADQSLGRVSRTIISGARSKVSGYGGGYFVDSFITDSEVRPDVMANSTVSDSVVIGPAVLASNISNSEIRGSGISLRNSTIGESRVIRADFVRTKGKKGSFQAVDSDVNGYVEPIAKTDLDISLIEARVTGAGDVKVVPIPTEGNFTDQGIVSHPDKKGGTTYTHAGKAYKTARGVVKATNLGGNTRRALKKELRRR